VEMKMEKREAEISINDYLSRQNEVYGTLVNQGLAQIPDMDTAYVKVFQDQGIQKMQFFLFKTNKVVKILVYPSDPPKMKVFDKIIQTLKIEN